VMIDRRHGGRLSGRDLSCGAANPPRYSHGRTGGAHFAGEFSAASASPKMPGATLAKKSPKKSWCVRL
jgi:hypothetical protein